MKNKRIWQGLTAVLFCLYFAGMVLWHLCAPDREKSNTENRVLSQMPAFTWDTLVDGSFGEGVEKYLSDQFPLRDNWIGIKVRFERLIGRKEYNGVYLCKDTLIQRVEPAKGSRGEDNLGYVKKFADSVDVPVYFGLIPTAEEIWKGKLPANAVRFDQKQYIEHAKAVSGAQPVDLYGALQAHEDEEIYYRTDHHWTTLGAFYGANAILEAMGKEPLSREDFKPQTASEDFCGTLYSSSGIHWLKPDVMEYWVREEGLSVTSWREGEPMPSDLYVRSYLEEKDKYASFLGGNQSLCVIKNTALPDGDKILLVRDSYSDSLAPFLAQRFSEVHLVDLRYYRQSVSSYADENGMDEVLVLYNVRQFLEDNNIAMLPGMLFEPK